MKDLQGCWTVREKADVDRRETYILRFFFPLHIFSIIIIILNQRMLFQSKAAESFILKMIKKSLSVYHLADNACKKTPKTTFHFQPKLFNVLDNIDPYKTQIFGRIIILNPPFLLISDLNLMKTEYGVCVV